MKRPLYFAISVLCLTSCQKTNKPTYYTVKWLNYDNSVLEVDEKVLKGEIPTYNGETPTKPSDDTYDYSFIAWDKELKPVESDISFVATYNAFKRAGYVEPNHESGFYDKSFDLSLKAPQGFDIYYTFDNSDPTENSAKYTSSIHIDDVSNNPNYYSNIQNISSLDVYFPTQPVDKCKIVKAVAINRETKERSKIYHFNYFVGYQDKYGYEKLPIVSLDVNDGDLFDYEKGIYVTGKIYDESEHTGYPETWPANYQQKGKEWERKANFKYFDENKSLYLEQDIGIRIHGGWSRAFNQKSFNLYARKEYSDTSTFDKQFFDNINPHSLMLRSGGYRDTYKTKIRDSLNQDLSLNETFDVQRSQPVIAFLNGEYWGIYNLQERYSDNYVKEHHDIDKKNVLIIKNDEIDEGKESDYHYYEELISFFQNHDMSLEENYELAKRYIDMDEFSQYMSTQLYVGNIDWPGNNVRVYKDVANPESKWHFMMYDTDDSSDIFPSKCAVDVDPFLKSSHWKSGPLEEDCLLGLMLSKLIQNNTFKQLFRSTFIRIGGENFSPNRVKEYLNSKKNVLGPAMANNYYRFLDSMLDEDYFNQCVDVIQSFFDDRYSYAISYLNEHITE